MTNSFKPAAETVKAESLKPPVGTVAVHSIEPHEAPVNAESLKPPIGTQSAQKTSAN